jgi:CRISPR-associated endoribonuclease Cas6
MRFKLTLKIDHAAFGNSLPLNYQYELSSFIYRTIAHADQAYSLWLHENGFRLNGKQFKLFTFSNLLVPLYKIDKEAGRIRIESDRITWLVSFLPDVATEKFVHGLFSEQVFQIGDKKSVVQFRVEQIEALPSPVFEPEMRFKMLSPACIPYRTEMRQHPEYVSPEHPETAGIVLNNLLNKYHTFYHKPYEGNSDFVFQITNQPKAKLIKIKAGLPAETFIKGYVFEFKMKTSRELMRIAYEAGIGEKGSQGFGMVEIVSVYNKIHE